MTILAALAAPQPSNHAPVAALAGGGYRMRMQAPVYPIQVAAQPPDPRDAARSHPARPISCFEKMAEAAAMMSAHRQELLGVLLPATVPLSANSGPIHRPVWANEAMQRAYELTRMVAQLDRNAPLGHAAVAAARAELALATELSDAFRALDFVRDEQQLACSGLLRTLVRDLAELFGPVAGEIELRTQIEPVMLPAFQRRALVLSGCALVMRALGPRRGQRGARVIAVTLARLGPSRVLLRVSDDGRPDPAAEPELPEVVADLAGLLDCEPHCRRDCVGDRVDLLLSAPAAGWARAPRLARTSGRVS
jgi:hypothetical protein